MSLHTICDKCMKVIDQSEGWISVSVATLQADEEGAVTVVVPAVTYDYHSNHAPKLTKGTVTEPEPEEPVIDNTLPDPEDA